MGRLKNELQINNITPEAESRLLKLVTWLGVPCQAEFSSQGEHTGQACGRKEMKIWSSGLGFGPDGTLLLSLCSFFSILNSSIEQEFSSREGEFYPLSFACHGILDNVWRHLSRHN